MTLIDYGPLPGGFAHDELWQLQKALFHLDRFGVMDPFFLAELADPGAAALSHLQSHES